MASKTMKYFQVNLTKALGSLNTNFKTLLK